MKSSLTFINWRKFPVNLQRRIFHIYQCSLNKRKYIQNIQLKYRHKLLYISSLSVQMILRGLQPAAWRHRGPRSVAPGTTQPGTTAPPPRFPLREGVPHREAENSAAFIVRCSEECPGTVQVRVRQWGGRKEDPSPNGPMSKVIIPKERAP